MHVCSSLQTDNHASNPPLSFLQARCPSCHPTNSIKALMATALKAIFQNIAATFWRDVLELSPMMTNIASDAAGWVAGRASGLYKTERWGTGMVI